MAMKFDLSLYLVLDPELCGDYGMVATTRDAIAGGAAIVQLRMKHASTRERIDMGLALKQVTAGTPVRLIVNDDVEAAIAIDADGVHVGQEDARPKDVRDLIGDDKILGVSVNGLDVARAFDPAGIDYIGAGPIFATGTKPDHALPVGFHGLREMINLCRLPTVAIGGLKGEHVAATFESGADGIAVVSAICGQPDPYQATADLAEAIRKAKQ
ncbi:thiamine phosphate synthase [Martelella mediterranea]|uniref:Thiamine-phosphate synthase n=1 Tax=Martelella mediterranea DSM 17316 TaxID=1122214 RepID=A0A1U9Z245_9HYPH|nr:Thiamine-phosphate synthase [Martelella mediterranea DSM 17316]